MTTIQDLIAQRDALTKAIQAAQKAELAGVVAQVKALVAEFGLSPADVFGGKAGRSKKTSSGTNSSRKIPAKYRDPETGKEWTGRGSAPAWINGKEKTAFLIRA